jgi:hypothetical protein
VNKQNDAIIGILIGLVVCAAMDWLCRVLL